MPASIRAPYTRAARACRSHAGDPLTDECTRVWAALVLYEYGYGVLYVLGT